MQRGILSADDNEYYLIHPLPRRLQQSNLDQPHIIVRRPASYLSKHTENKQEPPLKPLCPHNLHPTKKYWSKHRRKKYPEVNLETDDWQKANETKTDEDWKKESTNLTVNNRDENTGRKKRAVHSLGSPVFVETAVFVDRDLFQHMRANYPIDTERELVRFVLAMINAVSICLKKYDYLSISNYQSIELQLIINLLHIK